MRLQRACLLFCALGAFACVGTDVGNPPDDDRRVIAKLEFEAAAPPETSHRGLMLADGTEFTAAWLSIDAVRVRSSADGCSADGATERVEGPFYVDLIGRRVLPEPVIVADEASTICSLQLDFGPAAEDAPAALVGLSVLVLGTGDEGRPLSLQSSTRRAVPYAGNGFVVGETDAGVERFVNTFDPTHWFRGFDAEEVTDATPSIVNAFFGALRTDSRIVRDTNSDGVVSPDEFSAAVALPQ